MDLKIVPDSEKFADLDFQNNDFSQDDGLKTAIMISLFSDRRADLEELPPEDEDPRGWWGDTLNEIQNDQVGSRLWLLQRQKHTSEVRELAREYVIEALNWLIEDGVASGVNVSVDEIGLEESTIQVEVVRPFGRDVNFKYSYVWSSLNARNQTDTL